MSSLVYRSLAFLGYPKYRVGSDGSVWSYRLRGRSGERRILAWRKLDGKRMGKYIRHHLSNTKRGKGRSKGLLIFAHRLVLLAFVGQCPEGMQCCHNDGDGSNNCLSNLRWDTPFGNYRDKIFHGTAPVGERSGTAKMSNAQVQYLREKYSRWKGSQRAFCRKYAPRIGIKSETIRGMLRGHCWNSIR